jgi:hypothetical protein
MRIDLGASTAAPPLTALALGACVSKGAYEQQTRQLQAAQAQAALSSRSVL